ncbi:hypothetical protein BD779DRAFT_1557343 [Infundibulicybe gibba]|nr:hypothetical protein BD779DRAFT_1557343 [Infundibulicybe gibba]
MPSTYVHFFGGRNTCGYATDRDKCLEGVKVVEGLVRGEGEDGNGKEGAWEPTLPPISYDYFLPLYLRVMVHRTSPPCHANC